MDESTLYSIEFLPTAVQDLTEIISMFIMLGSKQGAVRIKEKVNHAAVQLQHFPYSGVTIPDEKLAKSGFRMIIIEKYLMIHKVFDDEKKVIVYHVLNGARDYPMLMKRIHQIDD